MEKEEEEEEEEEEEVRKQPQPSMVKTNPRAYWRAFERVCERGTERERMSERERDTNLRVHGGASLRLELRACHDLAPGIACAHPRVSLRAMPVCVCAHY